MTTKHLSVKKIVNLAADPATGSKGEMYFNTTSNTYRYHNGTGWVEFTGGSGNSFQTISTPNGTSPVADSSTDTLNLVESNGVTITGNSTTDSVTIATNATPLNTASTIVSRDADQAFDITAVDFDTTGTIAGAVGRLHWDAGEGTLQFGMPDGVTQSIGMEFYMPPTKNDSGVVIPNGSFVMYTGVQGDRVTIAKAVTNGSVDPMYMIGVATQDIAKGSTTGIITTNGTVRDIDTSAWPVGTALYPDPATAGGLTSTQPAAPNIRTPIAIVLRQHAMTGRIYVRMTNGSTLGGTDSNVKFGTASDNDIISYDSAQSVWKNQNLATAITEVDGTGSGIDADLLDGQHGSYYAPLAGPTFTGTVTLPSTTSIGNVSSTEIGYLDGVTSAIQTQLGNKQPLDADLTAIAGLSGTSGLLKKTAADTWSLDTSTYLTANQTITLSGDVSGSGTTAITVTVSDDSHSHTGTTISALDASDTTTGTFNIARIPTGTTSTTVALGNHLHTGVYQPLDGDLTAIAALAGTSGLLKKTAADTWALDTTAYLTGNQTITLSGDVSGSGTTAITVTVSDDSHFHTGTTISALDATDVTTGTFDIARIPTGSTGTTVSLGNHSHSYQPLDADLTAIAGLAGTSGLLKKTAADTWTLDTSTYLTANQTITLSGDASGSGTTAITVTVSDDSHSHSNTTVSSVDASKISSGTLSGDRGVTAGSTSSSFVEYNGTTATAGQFDGGTTTPTGTTRLNYGGYFYPTFINLIGSADTATAATHYFVETGSDGFVRPKTLANVKAEVVVAAEVLTKIATINGYGATGGGSDHVFYNNGTTVTTSYSIPSGNNSMSAGPITINSGITVTVPSGSTWTVV